YVELHIEQGGVLDQAGIPIGIVEGIVAIDRYDVEIRGFANHAGTTPMPVRKDALLAAAQLIEGVNEIVRHEPGAQVGTVGHDAQMMATLGRMGMIFVPSVAGVSHSPKEFTKWEDCARGAEVLLNSVLELAK